MKSVCNTTNGYIVLSDSFSSSVFKQSFVRMFTKDQNGFLNMGFNATMEVQTSRELKVCGLIGPAVSANKKVACVGETVLVILTLGNWYLWYKFLEVVWDHPKHDCRCLL